MKVDITNKSSVEIELSIAADSADLAVAAQKVSVDLQKEVSAPGFRKGKMPLNLVREHTDSNYFDSKVADAAVSSLLAQACKDNDLRPVVSPRVSLGKYVPDSVLEFKAEIEVVPTINLPKFDSLKKLKVSSEVSYKEVDKVLAKLSRDKAARKKSSEPLVDGDEAIIDFSAKDKDGANVDGASGSDFSIVLGSKDLIPGFEKQLVGLKTADKKDFKLVFPTDYPHPHLAGSEAVFSVVVNQTNKLVLPKIDDTFAKSIGDFADVASLKKDIKTQLQQQREATNSNLVKQDIVTKYVSQVETMVPPTLVSQEADQLFAEQKQKLMESGQTMETFLKTAQKNELEYKKEVLEPQASSNITTGMVLSELASKNEINVDDTELRKFIESQSPDLPAERVDEFLLDPNIRQQVASRLLSEKTVEFLVSKAK